MKDLEPDLDGLLENKGTVPSHPEFRLCRTLFGYLDAEAHLLPDDKSLSIKDRLRELLTIFSTDSPLYAMWLSEFKVGVNGVEDKDILVNNFVEACRQVVNTIQKCVSIVQK